MTDAPVPQQLLPRHVAIIMDGNGRWAKKRGMPRAFGHRKGVEALEPIIEACGQWGIEALTLFAFSTENWARPKDEVNALMGLINEFFNKKIDELNRKGVCIRMLGDLSGVPEPQRRAAQRLARRCASGEMAPEDIDDEAFSAQLYTAGLPKVDLLIRTSGEQRISNFLLYQIAYAELVFVEENWPDFTREVFARALTTYAQRDRRFGKV